MGRNIGIGEENRISIQTKIKPDMVLYQFNFFNKTKYVTEGDKVFNSIIGDITIPHYKLSYYKEYNGMTDVIVYFKVGERPDYKVFCYTFENKEFCRVCSLKNLEWKNNYHMINFVIPLFAAFREQGITFINDSINEITDEYNRAREIKPKQRKRSRKEI